MTFENIMVAAAGGILPALVWLLFWIREDRKHPEPVRLLALAFFVGMLVVIPTLKLETIIYTEIGNETTRLIWWSVTEELMKFLAAYFIILRRKEVDEPIDYVVYMVAIALGFAALENTFFIFKPLADGLTATNAQTGILTGSVRFIGATLLHIVSSASIGTAMALSFYKSRGIKRQYLVLGLFLAALLHTAFNVAIMIDGGNNTLVASCVVWIAVICLLLMLEKVKKVHPVRDRSLETTVTL